MTNKSTEDYLKHIFWLNRLVEKVTTKSIADRMGISSASVTDMIKKLTHNGYLIYEPYYGVKLTPRGEKLAIHVIRRHRLIESFLVTALGYAWDKVHDEAERLEHVISEEMEFRIDQFLGYPKFDPHGDPIPSQDGVLEESTLLPLSQLDIGESGIIQRISDSTSLLNYVGRLDIALGTRLAVEAKEVFDGSTKVKVDNKKVLHLSRDAADQIFIKSNSQKKIIKKKNRGKENA